MSEWISVDDRLPAEEVDVLVFGKRGVMIGYTVAGVFGGQWASFETEEATKFDVTHWMPLPELPK